MPYIFTKHATEQYVARLQRLGATIPKDPERVLRRLVDRATEVRMDNKHTVRRIINHGFKVTRYLEADGWRFVVSEDNIVLTVEHTDPAKN